MDRSHAVNLRAPQEAATTDQYGSKRIRQSRDRERRNRARTTADGGAGALPFAFLNLAPALKNTSFSEEQEWRLIGGPLKVGHPQIRFRPASWAVVPYFEFELTEKEPLEIEEIVVGPNPYPELARRSVEYLVASLPVNCQRVTECAGTIRISG